ncbi:MAG: PQQ-dependent sugar dehydrogenase [Flavobacteriales bacterium]
MRTSLLVPALLITTMASAQSAVLDLVPWAEGLTAPVDIVSAGDDRLFVVQQNGVISIITDSMTIEPTPFLDISDSVVFDGEQGLLGLVFDPDFQSNGYFYVNYISATGGLHSRISRFSVSDDMDVADSTSERIIYTVEQPFSNHNGGDLEFGPDGYLYSAFGDGGGVGDPLGNAQDLSDPLGDIIRIDVSDTAVAYTVPDDNPYVLTSGVLPEIWASGLRNPYRFGFDQTTGDLWIGDVGQGAYEEIDLIDALNAGGENFGWRCYEGFEEYDTTGCGPIGDYQLPVTVHFNGGDGWCAIIGGRVYRGAQWPNLVGRYIYTDFCVGEFWSITELAPGNYFSEALLTNEVISGWSCIGEDANGELYACNVSNGMIYKIVDACPMPRPTITFENGELISSEASSYLWYLNGEPIPGATEQRYTPTENGDYFVQAAMNGCVLKSDIYPVMTTNVVVMTTLAPSILPNPADENATITIPDGTLRGLRVIDMQGREVLPLVTLTGLRTTLSTMTLPEGNYIVQFIDMDANPVHQQRLAITH